jgi:hypothetical protein
VSALSAELAGERIDDRVLGAMIRRAADDSRARAIEDPTAPRRTRGGTGGAFYVLLP